MVEFACLLLFDEPFGTIKNPLANSSQVRSLERRKLSGATSFGSDISAVLARAAENNNSAPPTTVNATTCSATFVVTEPATAISGTKAYAGITGTINVTISYAFVLPLDKGKCNMNTNANPSAAIGQVTGTGTVSYG